MCGTVCRKIFRVCFIECIVECEVQFSILCSTVCSTVLDPVGNGGFGQKISGQTKGNFNSLLFCNTLKISLISKGLIIHIGHKNPADRTKCPAGGTNCLVYLTKRSTIKHFVHSDC